MTPALAGCTIEFEFRTLDRTKEQCSIPYLIRFQDQQLSLTSSGKNVLVSPLYSTWIFGLVLSSTTLKDQCFMSS